MEDTVVAPTRVGRELTPEELETFVVEMVQHHAESLLRLARRNSLCADDAHDAYQRGFEIFLRHAHRLDRDRAASWLRTVVKHEAMAVRRGRLREVGSAEVDFDLLEARNAPSPDERIASFELVSRSAEALQRLKPQEVRALWLRAEGHSYDEIQALTGWTRTKVNRCLYEGRRAFLSRYAGIESGDECVRWEPQLSLLVDGEATTEQLLELRPHLRNCASCRAVVRELHRATIPLGVVFPPGAVLLVADHAEHGAQVFVKVYGTLTTWMTERATSSLVRAQLLVDSVSGSASKATAVAASAAAVAGGGAVAIQQVAGPVNPGRAVAVAPVGRATSMSEARGSVHEIALQREADRRRAIRVHRERVARQRAARQQQQAADAAARRAADAQADAAAQEQQAPEQQTQSQTVAHQQQPAQSSPASSSSAGAGAELGFE